MSTVRASTYQDASGGSAAQLYGVASPPNSMGFRNRILNGDCRIDQRNAGASVTPSSSAYTLDRWQMDIALASKFSVQQISDAPAGFTNSVRLTVVSSYTPGAGNAMFFRQSVEGLNVSDLAWGTASAQAITVSFWVKASVTGTYSFAVGNNANNYHYIATYAVSAANTWEFKTTTISGPTAGTWLTDNNAGLRLKFDLGSGSNFNGTAGVWSAADVARTSGSVVLGSNSSATWQVTGVQLEAGSVASPFERRDYGRELAMCQRYYQQFASTGTGGFYMIGVGNVVNASLGYVAGWFKTTMRATPSFSYSGTLGTDIKYSITGDANPSAIGSDQMNVDGYAISVSFSGATAGQALRLFSLTTAGKVKFSAEL